MKEILLYQSQPVNSNRYQTVHEFINNKNQKMLISGIAYLCHGAFSCQSRRAPSLPERNSDLEIHFTPNQAISKTSGALQANQKKYRRVESRACEGGTATAKDNSKTSLILSYIKDYRFKRCGRAKLSNGFKPAITPSGCDPLHPEGVSITPHRCVSPSESQQIRGFG